MDAPASRRFGVLESSLHITHEFRLASRQRRETPLTLAGIARRQIEQHVLEPVTLEARRDLSVRELVRLQKLDCAKSCRGRGFEAVEERHLREEPREVGGELGHGARVPART